MRGLFGLVTCRIKGRMTGEVPRTGELNPDIVREALGMDPCPLPTNRSPTSPTGPRPCARAVPTPTRSEPSTRPSTTFDNPQVFSDIGCYTLAALPPLEAVHSCVAMGASIGMAAGAAHAGYSPAVAAIGDSTFSHGGITPLLSAVQQNVNLNVLVVDNSTVGMTGTQRSMSTGSTLDQIILGTGISEDHFRIIEPTPRNHDQNVAVMREELAYDGPSVIVARRACIEALRTKAT